MDNLKIKPVTAADLEKLQAISRSTFTETFSHLNTAENMQAYLDDNLSIERLNQELSNPSSQFYFAMLGHEIIGYLKLNTGQAQTEIKDENALEIERIYIQKAHHGKKLGQLLYEHAIKVAADRDAEYIWLGVWEDNFRAIAFYTKNGFVAFDKHVFMLGDDVQTDIMMRKEL